MSEVRLVIRDAQQAIYADIHGGFAERAIAALSAEPETIEELDVALERFIAPSEWSFFRGFRPGMVDESHDAGLVVIDLAARLVVCDSTYSRPSARNCVEYHDGKCLTDVVVRYVLSDDWRIIGDAMGWQALAEQCRRDRLANPPLDYRAVLYGEQLLEFIARECLPCFRGHPVAQKVHYEDPIYQQDYDLVRQIHASWMMTPRENLKGRTPREVLVEKRHYLGLDLQDRSEQWAFTHRCPRALDEESAAYRFAGFGTHEIVMYYEMVRHLLWSCRQEVAKRGAQIPSMEDFVAGEIGRLAQERERWLDTPDPEHRVRTPRNIIESERARIPETMSPEDAIIDDDCPLCQMQAEMPGPMFCHIDGCNMDEDFAFSMHETREEWEEEQRSSEEFSRRFDEKMELRKQLGVECPDGGYAVPDSVWQTSFSASRSAGQSMTMRVFAIGSHLCELILDLTHPTEQRDLIDRLSRAFGNLREVVRSADAATADALIEPVLGSFRESLGTVAAARPDLVAKCSDLQDRLLHFLEPPDDAGDAAEPLGGG